VRGSCHFDLTAQRLSQLCVLRIGKIAVQHLQLGPSSLKIRETLLEDGKLDCRPGRSALGSIMFGARYRLATARQVGVGPIVCGLSVDTRSDTLVGCTASDRATTAD
jgi:hypothetical protein